MIGTDESKAATIGPALSWFSLLAYWFIPAVFLFGSGNTRYPAGTRTFWGGPVSNLLRLDLLGFNLVLIAPFIMAGLGIVLSWKGARTQQNAHRARWLFGALAPAVVVLGIGLYDLFNGS